MKIVFRQAYFRYRITSAPARTDETPLQTCVAPRSHGRTRIVYLERRPVKTQLIYAYSDKLDTLYVYSGTSITKYVYHYEINKTKNENIHEPENLKQDTRSKKKKQCLHKK